MISNELLGMTLVFIGIFGLCLIGYIYEYIRYCWRFRKEYGIKVLSRAWRYLKRL